MIMFHLQITFLMTVTLSIQTGGPADQWFVVSPPGVGARVEMPTIPQFKENSIRPVRDLPEILVRSRSSVINAGNTNLTFVYHDEAEIPAGRNKVNLILNGAMTGAMALVNGELISQEEIFVGSNKGRDFTYICEISDAKLQRVHDLKIRTRLILVGRRLFSLNYISVVSEYDDSVAERFFNSFELVNKPDDLPPEPRTGRERQLAEEAPDPDVPTAKPSEPIRSDPVADQALGEGGESDEDPNEDDQDDDGRATEDDSTSSL